MARDGGSFRVVARGIVWLGGHLLVAETSDPRTGGTYCTLVGGRIEAGETSAAALARAFDEDLSLEVAPLRLVYVSETAFPTRSKNVEGLRELALFYLGDIVGPLPQTDEDGYLRQTPPDYRARFVTGDALPEIRLYPRFLRHALPVDVREGFRGTFRHVVDEGPRRASENLNPF
jgi:ADP-ribose pyrophosphatase YjhB (NUDIX family)